MLSLIRKSLEKTNNIKRSSYVWNAINAIVSALESPVILMVMNRTNGLYDAGIFSIAFAVAALMLYVGQYGLRRFQSSDINAKYSFAEYHGARVITCSALIIASICYCVYGIVVRDYSAQKAAVVIMICMLRLIQAYVDVMHGHLQQKGRLDIAAKASAIRYIAEIIVYVVTLIITHDLIISTITCLMASLLVFFTVSVNVVKPYCDTLKPSMNGQKIRMLIIEGFPLFVSLFLNMYISNAPKYAIDAHLTEEIQTTYNCIFMPAFVVMLIAHFIFNPILTSYAELWLEHTREKFTILKKAIIKQTLIIAGLALLGILVAYTIGIPVLSIIFGVDLSEFKEELCVIMIGGGFLAYSYYYSTVITIIRVHSSLFVCYGAVALAAKIFAGWFVVNHGIMGAAALYTVLMAALTLMLIVPLLWAIRKESISLREKREEK
ncbi:MAG: hypothetical protein Q4A65_01895 [Bacillota bacterium]|nr:hypothetical protein [Bacillota bacterium]